MSIVIVIAVPVAVHSRTAIVLAQQQQRIRHYKKRKAAVQEAVQDVPETMGNMP